MKKFNLSAGLYYIGDPCHVMKSKDYEKIPVVGDGIFDCGGQPIFKASTAFGDGVFYDAWNHLFRVDAGILGATPVELMDNRKSTKFGRIVNFPNGLTIKYNGHLFDFGGKVRIETRHI